MGVSKKLGPLAMLNMLFMIVLAVIYWLIEDRMNYAAAAELEARSVKYGMLIVLLTFGVFFMHELLKELRIHPMQYILVGAALAIFYLLLLSFSEKIGFTTAYIIASIACISLIAWYLQFFCQNCMTSYLSVVCSLSPTPSCTYYCPCQNII